MSNEWIKINRVRVLWERRFKRPTIDALKAQFSPIFDAITINGYEYALSNVETLIKPDAIEKLYKTLYVQVGSAFAKLEHATKSGLSKEELKADDEYRNIWEQEMINYFEVYGAEKVIQITSTTQEYIKTKIKAIIAENQNLGVDALGRAIRRELQAEYYGKTAIWRAKRIAQTEIMTASNYAQIMATEQFGYDYVKTWLTGGMSKTERHTTYPGLHGQTINKGEYFDVNGYKMLQPGDSSQGAPAEEVINCKCVVTTTLKL